MPGVNIATAKNAKQDTAAAFVKNEERFGIFLAVTNAINKLWPKKTTAHVSFLTGVSERSVQFWLAGETRMSLEHAAALMRTDEGYLILKAIMGDCKAEWWIDTMMAAELRESRKIQRAEARRMKRLKELRSQREFFED